MKKAALTSAPEKTDLADADSDSEKQSSQILATQENSASQLQKIARSIEIQGARVNTLNNVSCKLPQEKITVITGPSGSGKSSLAFDTLYAEGQRRYIESMSSYARQFLI